jgi:hypothetical protein
MAGQTYYVRIRGKVMGPFPIHQLRGLKERGQLQSFHDVSTDRLTWLSASTVSELFPSAEPAPQTNSSSVSTSPTESQSSAAISNPGGQPPAGSMDGWYIADDMGNRQGPIDAMTFKIMKDSGQIEAETMVWRQGMTDWVKAEKALPKLFRDKKDGKFEEAKSSSKKTKNNPLESLRKTKLGILLLLLSGAIGLICLPISPVAYVLALIGVGFCMSAPNPAKGPASLTFYFGLGTGLLYVVWLGSTLLSLDMVIGFIAAVKEGTMFMNRNAREAGDALAAGASLTFLVFIGVTFLFAIAMFFTTGGFLQHTLKKLAIVSEDEAIIKLAGINFSIYCILSGLFVTLIYLFVLIPILFVSGIIIISPLVIPKVISIIFFIEAGLLFCVVICYIITLVVMMQLHSRFGKLIEDQEESE